MRRNLCIIIAMSIQWQYRLGGVIKISPVSDAQKKATKEWEKRNYDSVNLRLPKGTKQQIQATGETVNGFINKAVADRLEQRK